MAWEIGGGLGHVVPLLVLARRFRSRGHEPVFALKNIIEPSFLFEGEDFAVLQAPVWPEDQYRGRVPPTRDFADILAFHGLADPVRTLAMVKAWRGLVDAVRPDAIVADYCPALCLAARGRVPVMAMGLGFTLPPAEMESFPPLLPDAKPLIDRQKFLDRINAVQQAVGGPTVPRLPAVMDADARFVMCLPIFDPYAAHRAEPADGPLDPLPDFLPPVDPGVFVYLSMEIKNLGTIFDGLKEAGLPVTAFVRGASPKIRRKLAGPNIKMLDAPVPYPEILPRCSMVVHHGGLSTATTFLSAGRPQIVVPARIERRFNGEVVARRKAGLLMRGKFDSGTFAKAVRRVAETPAITDNAIAIAEGLDRAAYKDVPGRMVDRCLALLAE